MENLERQLKVQKKLKKARNELLIIAGSLLIIYFRCFNVKIAAIIVIILNSLLLIF